MPDERTEELHVPNYHPMRKVEESLARIEAKLNTIILILAGGIEAVEGERALSKMEQLRQDDSRVAALAPKPGSGDK